MIDLKSIACLLLLSYLLLQLGDCLARVEPLGTGLGAVHDGVAAVELECVIQLGESLFGQLVPRVVDPAEGLLRLLGKYYYE